MKKRFFHFQWLMKIINIFVMLGLLAASTKDEAVTHFHNFYVSFGLYKFGMGIGTTIAINFLYYTVGMKYLQLTPFEYWVAQNENEIKQITFYAVRASPYIMGMCHLYNAKIAIGSASNDAQWTAYLIAVSFHFSGNEHIFIYYFIWNVTEKFIFMYLWFWLCC